MNTPLTPMDRSSKQKINKETQVLNDTLDEMDLIDIFRTFYPNAQELEKEMATHSRIFAWKIPWAEEPGRLQSMVLQRVGHD